MIIPILIVSIFLIINIYVGFKASKNATSETMMNGGRKSGLLLLIVSTFATSIGAGDIFSYPSLGYEQGWSGLHFILAMPVIIIIMAFTVGKKYYRMNVKTISDLLSNVYGENKALRILSSLCLSIGLIATTAGQYSAFGKSLNIITGLPTSIGVLIGALVFVSYTVAGGLSSVMAVSFIQGFFMIFGILAVYISTRNAGGGFETIQSMLPENFHRFWGVSGPVTIITYWINRGLSKFTNFSYWQRLSSAKDENTGILGISIGMVVTGGLGIILALIGMNYFSIKSDMNDSELIFIESALHFFPKWFSGILLGTIWAAILSSAGGFLNSASTIIANDIYFKALNYERNSEIYKINATRIITGGLGTITLFVALLFPNVLDLLVWSGVCLTPMLLPTIIALTTKSKNTLVNRNCIIISIAISALIGIAFEIIPFLKSITSGGTIPAFLTSLLIILIGFVFNRKDMKLNNEK